jgi:hypothetical protein
MTKAQILDNLNQDGEMVHSKANNLEYFVVAKWLLIDHNDLLDKIKVNFTLAKIRHDPGGNFGLPLFIKIF